MIRAVYTVEPKFPATDQHPDAVRYVIGGLWVDAIGPEPTLAEVQAIVLPPPLTAAELEAQAKAALNGGGTIDLFKLIEAVALWQAQLHLKTAAQARDEIAAIYKTL